MKQKLEVKKDDRGKLIEIFRAPGFGQVNYSTSKPRAVRGNHYHNRKKEKFCVIEGRAKITLKNRDSGEVKEFLVTGENPEVVDIPNDWTHNIKNMGQSELKLLVWVDEVYNSDNPDTHPEQI